MEGGGWGGVCCCLGGLLGCVNLVFDVVGVVDSVDATIVFTSCRFVL